MFSLAVREPCVWGATTYLYGPFKYDARRVLVDYQFTSTSTPPVVHHKRYAQAAGDLPERPTTAYRSDLQPIWHLHAAYLGPPVIRAVSKPAVRGSKSCSAANSRSSCHLGRGLG